MSCQGARTISSLPAGGPSLEVAVDMGEGEAFNAAVDKLAGQTSVTGEYEKERVSKANIMREK